MDKKDFQDLLNEIDSMSVEEYNNFHEKALKMKDTGVYITIPEKECSVSINQNSKWTLIGTFSINETLTIDSQFIAFYMTATRSLTHNGDKVWPEAA